MGRTVIEERHFPVSLNISNCMFSVDIEGDFHESTPFSQDNHLRDCVLCFVDKL